MNLSNVFALSLLLVSPLALARVQMHTQAELSNSSRYGNHKTDIVFNIDANESLEVYNYENVRVVAELLAEEESTCSIRFAIYAKNEAGEFELILSPALVPDYTEPAELCMGSTEGDYLHIEVTAQRI